MDYYGQKKLAFEVVKRSQADVVLICREATAGSHQVVICNDRPDVAIVNYTVTDVASGELLLSGSSAAIPDGVTAVGTIEERSGEARLLALNWETRGVSRQSHYLAATPPVALDQYLGWLRTVGLSV